MLAYIPYMDPMGYEEITMTWNPQVAGARVLAASHISAAQAARALRVHGNTATWQLTLDLLWSWDMGFVQLWQHVATMVIYWWYIDYTPMIIITNLSIYSPNCTPKVYPLVN